MEYQWQRYGVVLKELFAMELSPVAVGCFSKSPTEDTGKVRICKAILDASAGETVRVGKVNNLCFGSSWHMGFQQVKSPRALEMAKKFVVEGEKLFSSYAALETFMRQLEPVPDNSQKVFVLTPLEQCTFRPSVVIFVVNAEQASRLLTFVTFFDGKIPAIKIGGPTCRMSIMYPLLTGEVNISFYDYTARKLSRVKKDQLLVTIPAGLVPRIIKHIDTCSGGKAEVRFPPEFRVLLQEHLTHSAARKSRL